MAEMRVDRLAVVFGLLLFGSAACGDNGEGEACDPGNGNTDCERGLVCTPAHAVKAGEPVCCPRAPSSPSVEACRLELAPGSFADPSIDGSFAAGGTGAGATVAGGAGGSVGTADSATDGTPSGGASSDAMMDGPDDGPADGSSGSAGSDAAADGSGDG